MTWQVVRWRRILCEKVAPLQVVVVPKHVKGLVSRRQKPLRPRVFLTIVFEGDNLLLIAVRVGGTQGYACVSIVFKEALLP